MIAIEAILSFCEVVKYPKNGVSYMNFRVSWKFFYIKELIAFLNVVRSINHKKHGLFAFIDADLGDEYSNASYPNPCPDYNFFFILPSIYTASSPSWRIKKELALSFCFIKYSPLFTRHNLNLSSKFYCITLSLIKLENIKCEPRLLIIRFLSTKLFFFSTRVKF